MRTRNERRRVRNAQAHNHTTNAQAVGCTSRQLNCEATWKTEPFASGSACISPTSPTTFSTCSTGKLPSLSEQELVDCAGFPNMGCNGGSMASAMSWISRNGGLCSESDYPYTSGDGSKGYGIVGGQDQLQQHQYGKQ